MNTIEQQQPSGQCKVNGLKASVTPSSSALMIDVSVSCTLVHLLSQHESRRAYLRPLLDVALAPVASEITGTQWTDCRAAIGTDACVSD